MATRRVSTYRNGQKFPEEQYIMRRDIKFTSATSLSNTNCFPSLKQKSSSEVRKLVLFILMTSFSSSYHFVSALRVINPELRNLSVLTSKSTRLQVSRIRRNPLHCMFATSSGDPEFGSVIENENANEQLLAGEMRQFVSLHRCSCSPGSMREARITGPLAALLSCYFSSLSGGAAVAMDPSYAGLKDEPSTFATSLEKYFPTALTTKQAADRVVKVLRGRGYTDKNTLFGASICSDEINACSNRNKCLFTTLQEAFGHKAFALGGLAGVPFVGKSGLSAYGHHVPETGQLLILYAPHVGISEAGRVGEIHREGRTKMSDACGAAIGAYKQIVNGAAHTPRAVLPSIVRRGSYDYEEDFIIQELKKRLSKDPSAYDPSKSGVDPIVFVTYQLYCMIRGLLYSEIAAVPDLLDTCSEVAMLGGVIVNQYGGDDYFQPLSFQVVKKNEASGAMDSVNLFQSAFGEKPLLSNIVGNASSLKDVLAEVKF